MVLLLNPQLNKVHGMGQWDVSVKDPNKSLSKLHIFFILTWCSLLLTFTAPPIIGNILHSAEYASI